MSVEEIQETVQECQRLLRTKRAWLCALSGLQSYGTQHDIFDRVEQATLGHCFVIDKIRTAMVKEGAQTIPAMVQVHTEHRRLYLVSVGRALYKVVPECDNVKFDVYMTLVASEVNNFLERRRRYEPVMTTPLPVLNVNK
jgi:hypothetical protein